MKSLPASDRRLLERAIRALEHDTYMLRLIDFMGSPLDAPFKLTTAAQQQSLDEFLRRMMNISMKFMRGTLDIQGPPRARGWLTQVAATSTGFTAGLFGAISIPAEVPIIMALVLRAVAEVARDFPVPKDEIDQRAESLFVMTLAGGIRPTGSESAYWSIRDVQRPVIIEASRSIVVSSATATSTQGMTTILNECLRRLGATLLEGSIGRLLPIVGAFSGAAMNFMIINHYRRVAAAHFSMLALEERYGHPYIRQCYLHAYRKKQKHPKTPEKAKAA